MVDSNITIKAARVLVNPNRLHINKRQMSLSASDLQPRVAKAIDGLVSDRVRAIHRRPKLDFIELRGIGECVCGAVSQLAGNFDTVPVAPGCRDAEFESDR
jgi:hypothetical protein